MSLLSAVLQRRHSLISEPAERRECCARWLAPASEPSHANCEVGLGLAALVSHDYATRRSRSTSFCYCRTPKRADSMCSRAAFPLSSNSSSTTLEDATERSLSPSKVHHGLVVRSDRLERGSSASFRLDGDGDGDGDGGLLLCLSTSKVRGGTQIQHIEASATHRAAGRGSALLLLLRVRRARSAAHSHPITQCSLTLRGVSYSLSSSATED